MGYAATVNNTDHYKDVEYLEDFQNIQHHKRKKYKYFKLPKILGSI